MRSKEGIPAGRMLAAGSGSDPVVVSTGQGGLVSRGWILFLASPSHLLICLQTILHPWLSAVALIQAPVTGLESGVPPTNGLQATTLQLYSPCSAGTLACPS